MKKIEMGTIVRTVVLGVALVNQALTAAGKNPLPFAEETIYEIATVAVTIIASLVSGWKNNSFTKEAIEADKLLRELKEERE